MHIGIGKLWAGNSGWRERRAKNGRGESARGCKKNAKGRTRVCSSIGLELVELEAELRNLEPLGIAGARALAGWACLALF